MKKLIIILSFLLINCAKDKEEIVKPTLICKTITEKKIIYESIGISLYAPKYYFFLNGTKTEVTKDNYYNYLKGQEYCEMKTKPVAPSY